MSYLNTRPLLYGVERSALMDEMELITDYPSRIADGLLADEIDIGLVPVATIPRMENYYINTDFCIGSNGPVASVCLFSEVPMEQIETVLLDYQSRTSVALAKLLLKEYWDISPQYQAAGLDFRNDIRGTTAAVVIGDRALEQRNISPYVFDLGEAWKKMTGLPFVFAAWVSNKEIDADFIRRFGEVNGYGITHIDEVLAGIQYAPFDLHDYYTKFLSYHLNAEKQQGLDLFLSKIR